MTNYYLPLTSCLKLPAITASVRGQVGCWGGQYSGKTARVFVKVIHLRTRECVTQPPSFLFQLIKKIEAIQHRPVRIVAWYEQRKTKQKQKHVLFLRSQCWAFVSIASKTQWGCWYELCTHGKQMSKPFQMLNNEYVHSWINEVHYKYMNTNRKDILYLQTSKCLIILFT